MENGLSAADVALLDGNNSGFGNSGMWIFGLIILMALANGGFGNNNYDRPASQSDVQFTSQFAQILDGNRDIMNQANNNTNNIVNAVNQSEYETIASMKDAQLQLQERLAAIQVGQADTLARFNDAIGNTRLEIAGLGAQTNQAIMQNRYEASLNTNAITDAIMLDGQKTRDLMTRNRMDDMQNQINQLTLKQETAGMLRYPMSATYSTPMPWWGNACTM